MKRELPAIVTANPHLFCQDCGLSLGNPEYDHSDCNNGDARGVVTASSALGSRGSAASRAPSSPDCPECSGTDAHLPTCSQVVDDERAFLPAVPSEPCPGCGAMVRNVTAPTWCEDCRWQDKLDEEAQHRDGPGADPDADDGPVTP